MANTIKVGKGLMWQLTRGKRENVEDLQDALNILSECCGIDCCKNFIRLTDNVTGKKVELSVESGVVVVTVV